MALTNATLLWLTNGEPASGDPTGAGHTGVLNRPLNQCLENDAQIYGLLTSEHDDTGAHDATTLLSYFDAAEGVMNANVGTGAGIVEAKLGMAFVGETMPAGGTYATSDEMAQDILAQSNINVVTNGNTVAAGAAAYEDSSGNAEEANMSSAATLAQGVFNSAQTAIITRGHATLTAHGLGSVGNILYASTATPGTITSTRPTSPAASYTQRVGYIIDANTIFVDLAVETIIGASEAVIACTNGSSIAAGRAVFIDSSGDAQNADPTTETEFPLGVFHPDQDKVVTHGLVTATAHGLGVQGVAVYVSDTADGTLMATKPSTTDDDFVIRVATVVDANTLYVQVMIQEKIGAGSGSSIIMSDGLTGSTTLGKVYYIGSSGVLTQADKDVNLTAKVFVIGTGSAGEGCSAGDLEVSGLTANTYYYLGDNGAPTATAPTASGDTVLGIGWAVSATVLKVQFSDPIYIS